MRAECLSAASVPHITALFRDYLSDVPRTTTFYAASPWTPNYRDVAEKLNYAADRRAAVAAVLERQNRGLTAGAKTLENIGRLRNGASAIVTGQQVALFGGPMFAILKALTAIKRAHEATRSGVDCVPIFWLASEDHDIAEVSTATLWEAKGGLRDFSVSSVGKENAPVGTVVFGGEMDALAKSAAEMLPDAEVANMLRECYRPGATFTDAFSRLFTRLFSDFGLILLDPSDKKLHDVAEPVLLQAVENSAELNSALLERGKQLESAEYHAQVKVTPSSTLLFALQDGARTAVHRANAHFAIGREKVDQKELSARVAAHPEQFSGNALFRPVIQDFLLPTIAYIGGPAEVAYFAQSEVVYRKILGRVTPILPRASATIVDAKAVRLLEKYELYVTETFVAADALRKKIGAISLSGGVQREFEKTLIETGKRMRALSAELKKLDPTLEDAATRAAAKMMYQISRLKTRAGNAETRKDGEIAQHAAFLSNALFPHNDLQERRIAGISFLGIHGRSLLQQLLDASDADCRGHQLLFQ